MVAFLSTLLRLLFQVFRSRRTILSEIALRKKENEILARKMGKKRVHVDFYDKVFLAVLNRAADIKRQLTLARPETVLSWQRTLLVHTETRVSISLAFAILNADGLLTGER